MDEQEWNELVRALRETSNMEGMVAAAQQIYKVATREDLPRLMELLKDDDFFVREAAAWPVSELAGPAALQELLVAFQRGVDQGHDNDGFTAALIDLVESNRAACREILQGLAESGDKALRTNTLWLVQFCGPAGEA